MRNCGVPKYNGRPCRTARCEHFVFRRSSVRLTAQERRDLELIVLERAVHRRLPAVLVETLRSRPRRGRALGVFRD